MSARLRILDPALPGLADALDPVAATPRLAGVLAGSPLAPRGEVRVLGVDLVKHKPGRRCALVYTLEGAEGRLRLFAKVFANDRGAQILTTMARVADAAPPDELLVPRPVGYVPELKLLVTEFLEGIALAPALYAGASREPARRMARAVAALHALDVPLARRWSPRKEARNTREWIVGLTGRGPGAPGRAAGLLESLERRVSELPPGAETPVHRDFYADQVWDCDGRTAILDLDDARTGDPAVDVGNFLAHLALRPLQFPETTAGCALARPAFLEAYLERLPAAAETGFRERVRFYEAASLLRLAGVYAARQRWAAELPVLLLDTCESVLSAREVMR